MSTERDSGSELIAPDGKSGFSKEDVLAGAETDDELYVEFDLVGESGCYGVDATVANISTTTQEDSRLEARKLHLEGADQFELIDLMLLVDPESAYTTFQEEIRTKRWGEAERETHEIDKLHTAEVTKA